MIHTGREWLAKPVMVEVVANGLTLVPSPIGAGYWQVTLQIVTATFGIVRLSALVTLIISCECCESVCWAGNAGRGDVDVEGPLGLLRVLPRAAAACGQRQRCRRGGRDRDAPASASPH